MSFHMTDLPLSSVDDVRAYLAAIIESSDDIIISKNLDGTITSWNPAAERVFGYTRQEAIGKHISLIIPENRLDEEFVIIGKIKAGLRIEHFETVRRTKSGQPVDLSITISPIKNDKGVIIGASKIAREISGQKAAERDSAYLASIVDSSDDAIISTSLEGIITSWNSSAQSVYGYTAKEAIGQNINILLPEEKLDEEHTILSKIKSGQRIDHFETLRKTRDGRLINISLTISPIRDWSGNIIGVSKIARDISKQKLTETQLLESNRRKDEFLANISHELRTPMNAVIGLANILGMSTTMSDKEKQYVSTLKQSADGLMELINNLLDFSRFETGALELESIEFDLTEVINKTVSLMGIKAQEKNLPLRVNYAPSLRKFYMGDPLRIQQILTNLVGNAIKFTEKGSVEINISAVEIGPIKTQLTISVADSGIGIPEEKIAAIFDKFVQADASTTRKYGGSGLGLSICKAFVAAMSGEISVQSREGLGSTFTVSLPLRLSKQAAMIDDAASDTQKERKNVLIVDDYEPNTLVVSAMLDKFGYDYDIAANGLEALRFFHLTKYDTIIMDVQMHDMDGFETTQQIRMNEISSGLKRTPIIAMTAHVMERDKQKCLETGMDDFIPKPFDLATLEATLKKYIAPPGIVTPFPARNER